MRRIPLLIVILCAACVPALSQGEIPVDMYTGTPSINIPIGTVSAIDVSQQVSLSYNANNASQRSWFGQGWTVQAGGSVSREVRGLPDDINESSSPSRKGWLNLYNSKRVAKEIFDFPALSDTSSGTYGTTHTTPTSRTGEPRDYGLLSDYNDAVDTEPDIFTYSFNGMSGKFVFDNAVSGTPAVRTIPYRDIKIDKTHGSDSKITSFTITTNDGYAYTFGQVVTASKKVVALNTLANHILSTDYKRYGTLVNYNVEWMLTEMKSPSGNTITYTYTPGDFEAIPDEFVPVTMYREDDEFAPGYRNYFSSNIYKIQSARGRLNPSTITGSTGSVIEFSYNTTDKVLEAIKFRDTRKGSSPTTNFVKAFTPTFIDVWYRSDSYYSNNYLYSRKFLSALTEASGCSVLPPYKFGYRIGNTAFGQNGAWFITIQTWTREEWNFYGANQNEVNYPLLYIYPNKSMKHRYRTDYIAGLTGTVMQDGDSKYPLLSIAGTLRSIDYPTGGRATFSFGQNKYHDEVANTTKNAEGLRIESIAYHDGTGKPAITKSFSYVDATGKSSGRIFRKPVYNLPAFQWKDLYYPASTSATHFLSYTNISSDDRHKYLTIRTDWSMAPNDADNVIGYASVKVSRTGAGYAIHEFLTPATYGQNKSGTWETPETKFARQPHASTANTPTSDLANSIFPSGGTWRFPNAPNPFYDYARGLPWRVSEYDQTGKLVKKTETTYQKLFKTDTSAHKVYGIKYDRFPMSEDNMANNKIYLFSKYFLLTDEDRVPLTETVTLYDVNDSTGTKYVTETTEYTYRNYQPKLLTQVKRTTADGTIYRTKFTYVIDYSTEPTGDDAVVALNSMAANTRYQHGVPVETVSTLQKPSGTELVTGASVVRFSPFGYSGKAFPESNWSLVIDAPISDFTNSSIIYSSGYKFSVDTRYKQQSAVRSYLSSGLPVISMSHISRDSTETGYAYSNSLPIVKSVKTTSNQSAFSDFDNTTNFSFSYATPYFSTGRSGANAFYPVVTLYKNNVKRVSANNYVISFWLKSNAARTYNVYIKSPTSPYSTTYATSSFSVPSTGSVFKYIEQVISFASIAASVKEFRVELQTSGLSTPGSSGFTAGLLPVIDDLFFFPEGTHLESYTYQIPYGIASVTTGAGAASHVEYDLLGRQKIVRDRDLNIIQKTTYATIADVDPLFADFSVDGANVQVHISATFRAKAPACAGTVTYEWDWGDGAGFATGTATQAHTFSTTGTKTVTLRVSAAGYTTKTQTMEVKVIPVIITGTICARGIANYDAATNTSVAPFYSCTDVPAPPSNKTAFKVTNVTGCASDCTYRWLRKDLQQATYIEVASGTLQYTTEKIVPNTNSFQVVCEVTRGSEPPVLIGPAYVNVIQP